MDFDSLEVEENTSVGEGSTVLGHKFSEDGDLVFSQVMASLYLESRHLGF